MKPIVPVIMILSLLFDLPCFSKTALTDAKPGTLENKEQSSVDKFIEKINSHNKKIRSYYGGIFARGLLKNKKFKAQGRVWSDTALDKLKLRFEDLIFRSPISVFLMEGNRITLYYPPQKKKIITKREDFQPAYDAGLPLPSDLLLPMLRGHFYLPKKIEHKSFKKSAKGDKVILVDTRYIINYILGKNGMPRMGIFQSRQDKKRVVFKYKNFKKVKGLQIPYHITIIPARSKNYLHLKIQWLRINKKIGRVWNLK